MESSRQSSLSSRRSLLKKSAVAGGLAWTAPVVLSFDEPVAAATGSISGVAFWCFDSATTEGWSIDNSAGAGRGLWQVDNGRSVSPSYSLHYGRGLGGDYHTGRHRNAGTATSPTVTLPSDGTIELEFDVWREVETYPSGTWDEFAVTIVSNGSSSTVYSRASDGGTNGVFEHVVIDLSAWAGASIEIVLSFDTKDRNFNRFEGVWVDNITVPVAPGGQGTSLPTVRTAGVPAGFFPERPEPSAGEIRRRDRAAS